MTRIFDDQIGTKYRQILIKYGPIITVITIIWLVSSVMLIIYRLDIGRFLAMSLGIVVTSIAGILIYDFIAMRILPLHHLKMVVAKLSNNENRILKCTFVNAAPGAITYLGLTFTILHIRPLDKENSSIIEVYVYDGTN
ncbi:MAG TPA: hypothetical protein DCM23_02825, partial [Firmicutes bacterium]|nr:hypothetical protein [Bacillota bacterium]